MASPFPWVPFYEAFADALLGYEHRREELFELVKTVAEQWAARRPGTRKGRLFYYLRLSNQELWSFQGRPIMDPFNVFGAFNRGLPDENRKDLAGALAAALGVDLQPPEHFQGIPILDTRNSLLSQPDRLWELFVSALGYAEAPGEAAAKSRFITAFDGALAGRGCGPVYLSFGLFWIRPHFFMPLDENVREYLPKYHGGLEVPGHESTGAQYVEFLEALRRIVPESISYPELSHRAWEAKEEAKARKRGGPAAQESAAALHPAELVWEAPSAVPGLVCEKNLILCGSPGTGKTYSTVQYATAIIEEKPLEQIKQEDYQAVFQRYKAYREAGLIEFPTFHQAYGYEEFIEGIRPTLLPAAGPNSPNPQAAAGGEIRYEIHDGVFKEFCRRAEQNPGQNMVLIIDEINRGNISRIFGELLTLIEPSKRLGGPEEMTPAFPIPKKPLEFPAIFALSAP